MIHVVIETELIDSEGEESKVLNIAEITQDNINFKYYTQDVAIAIYNELRRGIHRIELREKPTKVCYDEYERIVKECCFPEEILILAAIELIINNSEAYNYFSFLEPRELTDSTLYIFVD